jgi:hypothetical protein
MEKVMCQWSCLPAASAQGSRYQTQRTAGGASRRARKDRQFNYSTFGHENDAHEPTGALPKDSTQSRPQRGRSAGNAANLVTGTRASEVWADLCSADPTPVDPICSAGLSRPLSHQLALAGSNRLPGLHPRLCSCTPRC